MSPTKRMIKGTRKTAARKTATRKAAGVTKTKSAAGPREAAPAAEPPPATEGRTRLGEKYVCFECGAKFYDLNRPEPICPKCGADQRNRPKPERKPAPPLDVSRRGARESMAPLLDDDEDEAMVIDEDGLEIGLGGAGAEGPLLEEDEEEDLEEP